MAKAKSATAQTTDGAVLLAAVEPIRHDGRDIAPGETFAVAPEAAAALVDAGAASIAEAAE